MSADNVFKERKEEVKAYLTYLKEFERSVIRDKRKKRSEFFFRIAKANLFVMLYNMVESTTTHCLTDIDSAIKVRGLTPKTATKQIREQWLRDVCKENWEFKRLVQIVDVVLEDKTLDGLLIKKMVSMNVNQHELHSLSEKLGVIMKGGADGPALETVRNRRNELAHGNERFSVIGGAYDVSTLERLAADCISFLARFTKTINKYITKSGFVK